MQSAEHTQTTDFRAIGGVLRLVLAVVLLIGMSYGADWLLRAENYPVRHLYFEGPFKRVAHAELEAAVLDAVRGNFFLIDLDNVQRRLETVPWVHTVSVRRRFPQDIEVQFTEQMLVARWGADAWVNTSGDVVRLPDADLPIDAPRFNGPEGTAAIVLSAYQTFRDALVGADLEIASLQLTQRRSWYVDLRTLSSGRPAMALVLDDDQPRARLERFARVYEATLASQADAIQQIDLRYTNGFAVEWRSGRAPARVAAVAPRNEG
jgi:cell division protein FtsQ